MTWISVKHYLPTMFDQEVSMNVLILIDNEHVTSGSLFKDCCGLEWYDYNGEHIETVTHWMNLPEMPE